MKKKHDTGAKWETIREGLAEVKVPIAEKISRELPVFYNPVMEFNRTLSVLAVGALASGKDAKSGLSLMLPLAGTGVRAARIVRELSFLEHPSISIAANDINPVAAEIMEENLRNNISSGGFSYSISREEANRFMISLGSADYIDIDPFGSPNPFLDAAVRKVRKGGILAVTATDTAALCGTYPKACMRKYWSVPSRGPSMHETGLRILIRKVQLVAAQYETALLPVISYAKDHYMRVFFRAEKGKSPVDTILAKHKEVAVNPARAGPLWTGNLQDSRFLSEISGVARELEKRAASKEYLNHIGKTMRFIEILRKENSVGAVGVVDIHRLCKKHGLSVPPFGKILESLRKKGFSAERSHSNLSAVKTTAGEKDVLETISELLKE